MDNPEVAEVLLALALAEWDAVQQHPDEVAGLVRAQQVVRAAAGIPTERV